MATPAAVTGRDARLRRAIAILSLPLVGVLAVAGCGLMSPPSPAPPTIPTGATVNCGPIVEAALCQAAVQVAVTAQLNPDPIAAATLRRPAVGDDCLTAFHPCGPASVVVVLQSGDTVQYVPLIASADGWIRLDLVR